MALTGTQYQSMRLKFRGLLASPFAGLSEAELDSFIGQLAIDATGSVTAAQLSQGTAFLVGALSSPGYTAQTADIAIFLSQLVTAAPLVLQALPVARYQQLKNQFTGALSIVGIRNEAQMLAFVASFLITNFATLFPGTILRAIQGDIGVTAPGGFVSGALDQGPSARNVSQGTGASQPALHTVFNGKASILFDGINDALAGSLPLPAPATTPYCIYAIFKPTQSALQATYWGNAATGSGTIFQGAGTLVNATQFTGAVGNAGGALTNALSRLYAEYTGSASDRLKCGSNAFITGASAGNTADAGGTGCIGASAADGSSGVASIDLCLLVYSQGVLTAPQLAAIDAVANTYWGGVVI